MKWLHSSMTTVSNGLAAHAGSLQEPVNTSIPAKLLSPTSSPNANSTEHRLISLLGKKKNIKELKNTKLVIRRLPQNITMTELTQFLDPIPDHNYLYLARGDTEFSREDMLFSRAYINLNSQEDAMSFCKRLDGFPFKCAGRVYRPVFEYAPFHRVPKRTAVKIDNKEGTIVSDPDYTAYIQSLQEVCLSRVNCCCLLLFICRIINRQLRRKQNTRRRQTHPRPLL